MLNNELDAVNRSTMHNELEAVIKSLPKKKTTGQNRFTADGHLCFKELPPMFLKLFHKLKKGKNTTKLILSSQHYYLDTNPTRKGSNFTIHIQYKA
jgi:hypothetical protein